MIILIRGWGNDPRKESRRIFRDRSAKKETRNPELSPNQFRIPASQSHPRHKREAYPSEILLIFQRAIVAIPVYGAFRHWSDELVGRQSAFNGEADKVFLITETQFFG